MLTATTIVKRREKFHSFLTERGAEVLKPTNEWELVRFSTGAGVCIIYTNAKGRLSFTGEADLAWRAYESGKSWAPVEKSKRPRLTPHIETLLARDGDNCFLCWKPLETDISVEHLVPRTHGGPDHISNLVLMHSKCNGICGCMSAMEKIALRDQYKEHVK